MSFVIESLDFFPILKTGGFCPLLTFRVCTDYQNVITSDICFTSLQICGSLEEEEDFLGMISTILISFQQYLGLFKFLGRNHLIIKENWHISKSF